MAKKENSKNEKTYKMYVSNLGNTGTFYKDGKDKKGTEGTLLAVSKDGVYAKVGKNPFPMLFARADFNSSASLTCPSCKKKLKLVVDDSKDSKNSGKGKGSYGEFSGKNGGKIAKKLIKFSKSLKDDFGLDLDLDDDGDYKKLVELYKKSFGDSK